MQLKAVVFDWDLTLWNSWDIHLDLMDQTADVLGYQRPAPAEVGKEYSRPFLQHLTWFFPGDQERVVDTYMGFYYASVWQAPRLYPGIPELLKRLKDTGYRMAILSDKRQVFGIPEFEFSKLGDAVDLAQFFAEGMAPKPDPSGLQEVMKTLEVTPGETLFVGDSHRDIECAQRAGARSGAALWASVEPELVLALNPEFRWEKVAEVGVTLDVGTP
jgi:HAD superfamily hydrolase (TIGR01509 family)